MTALSQTASEFALEVMGWRDARLDGNILGYDWKYEVGHNEVSLVGFSEFRYTDLNAVMAAVQKLIDDHPRMTWVRLHFDNSEPGFLCEIDTLDSGAIASVSAPGACEALLAACVEAARRLKSAHASL